MLNFYEGARLLPKDAKKIDVLWSNPCPSESYFHDCFAEIFLLISMTHYNAMSLEVLSESRAGKVDCWDYAASNVAATCRFCFR